MFIFNLPLMFKFLLTFLEHYMFLQLLFHALNLLVHDYLLYGPIIKFTEMPLKNTLAKLTGHKNNRGLYRIN